MQKMSIEYSNKNNLNRFRQTGFTLIEIIIGIVIGSISLGLISTLIFPLIARSVEPMIQIRAAEYAQSMMEDVLAKRYDELSPLGGQPVCAPCSSSLGTDPGDGGNRAGFNDVDDYNTFCMGNNLLQDVYGELLDENNEYGTDFRFNICVVYQGEIGASDSAKRITVTVTPPSVATAVVISAYRGNY